MAARASLAFLGQEDVILSSEPQLTYFVEKYKGSTPYAQRTEEVKFSVDQINFGSEFTTIFPRTGDLITKMTFKINFPLYSLGSSSVLDSVGTLMINYAELYVGGQLVERLWGDFLALKFDLEVPQSKQGALVGLIGKGTTVATHTYTVPLPFSILKRGLPVCAFKEDVLVRISLRPSPFFTNPPVILTDNMLASIDTEFTYLSDSEIDFIRRSPSLYIFEQVQRIEFFAPQGKNNLACPLNFINSVKELFLYIQNDSAKGYDFSNGAGQDQLTDLSLYFNSTDRISSDVGTPIFLRNIQALEFHTRVPKYLFYMYSFSLDPESEKPTGHVNFSRLDKQILNLNLTPSSANRNIFVWAVSYNFLKISDSTADVVFKNFTG
jgi:hypothetical protein